MYRSESAAWWAGLLLAVVVPAARGQLPPARPLDTPAPPAEVTPAEKLLLPPVDPPLGFTGPSGVLPTAPASADFVPMEDRWRLGFPEWDRYDRHHPVGEDYPYQEGELKNPYRQNVFKGDYPIIGQHTFLEVTATEVILTEYRQIPTATTPFESTANRFQNEFFGRPDQFFTSDFTRISFDLFHGDAGFKQPDWRVKLTPVFNVNYLAVQELAVVSPDVTKGTERGRTWFALQEWFVESKLADLSPNYDTLSVRVGSQPFVSDFRGFIFSDTNRAVRLFGTLESNRDQFNLIFFDQLEKDTNSGLNSFDDRRQYVLIANAFRQDFIFPGYTMEASVHYDDDLKTIKYDKNGFLVRPDPVGVFQPHNVQAVYLGFAGDGHVDRFNITHAFYWALGRDSLNPLANQPQEINAQFAAAELSYDRDWARFRTSVLWSSGDGNINNRHATGFDSILDNPNFAGGEFSYFQRQNNPLFGVNLMQRMSLIPDLRSSKIQGQANFVNPGLFLLNFGVDSDLTPRLKSITNVNFLWFDKTNVLEQYLFVEKIDRQIGTDISTGIEYRPLLSNNVIITTGVATLLPGTGYRELYNRLNESLNSRISAFMQVELTY